MRDLLTLPQITTNHVPDAGKIHLFASEAAAGSIVARLPDGTEKAVAMDGGYHTLTITTQGDTGTPSVVKIKSLKAHGERLLDANGLLRVRVCNNASYADSTNATIAAGTGSTLVDTITANKDLVISPTAGAYATAVLTISGAVVDAQTVVLNGRTYYFSTGLTAVPSGNVAANIAAGGVKAQGKLTIIDAPTADDTMLIGSTNYTFKASQVSAGEIALGGASVASIETITVPSGSVAQVETFTCVADVASSLDGLYLRLEDEDGSVAFWFDVGNTGTTIPGGASALDRAIEVTGISADDTAAAVATAVASAINGDSKFSASATGAVVTVTHDTTGAVADGAAGTSTFTSFTVTTNGSNHALNETYFTLQDTDGSVAFWFDVGGGNSIPAGASAADRAVEITTVTAVMTVNTLATTIAAAINADSKFGASATNAVITVTAAEKGAFGASSAGTSGFTLAVTTAGVSASVQAAIVAAINGTDDINTANAQVVAVSFDDNDVILTARYTGVQGNAIATTETFTAGGNVFDAATLGTTTAGVDVTATQAGDALEAAINADTHAAALFTADNATGTVTITADVMGTAANSYASTETMTNGSFGGATFSGGITRAYDEYVIALTDATAESVQLRIGPAPIGGKNNLDYNASLVVTHAAP